MAANDQIRYFHCCNISFIAPFFFILNIKIPGQHGGGFLDLNVLHVCYGHGKMMETPCKRRKLASVSIS